MVIKISALLDKKLVIKYDELTNGDTKITYSDNSKEIIKKDKFNKQDKSFRMAFIVPKDET